MRLANQRTPTEKVYVAECRAGGAAAQPAPRFSVSAARSEGITEKTVKLCQEEWRAMRVANQRTTTEKVYVAQCRAPRHSYVAGGHRFSSLSSGFATDGQSEAAKIALGV